MVTNLFGGNGNIKSMAEQKKLFHSKPQIFPEKYHNDLFDPANKEALDFLTETRGLTLETIRRFKLGVDNRGYITIPIFDNGELISYKFRSVKGKHFTHYSGARVWVLNDQAFSIATDTGYIIITEGEFDAMALWQLGFPSVISDTAGAHHSNMEWIGKIPEGVKVFICYDNDEPGQAGARKLAERIGMDRCFNIVLPCKDANDYIRDGYTKEDFIELKEKSKPFGVEGLVSLSDAIEMARTTKIQRFPTFLENFNENTKGGVPRKSLVVLSGITGIGKSTAAMNFLLHHASEAGGKHPVLLISLENDIDFTVQRLFEIKYNKERDEFTQEDWDVIKSELPDFPFYIDTSMKTYSIEQVERVVESAKRLYGIEVFCFDHLHYVVEGKQNITQEVGRMVKEFKRICQQYDIITYLVSHVRKMKSDQLYVTREDLKDSSATAHLADMILICHSTKSGYEISIDKSRMSRSHLQLPVAYWPETGRMADDKERDVRSFGEKIVGDKETRPEWVKEQQKIRESSINLYEEENIDGGGKEYNPLD